MIILECQTGELPRTSANFNKLFRISVLAAPQGFEPRYAAPEAAVLPLNEGATRERLIRFLRPDWPGPRQGAGHQNQLVHHKWIEWLGQTLTMAQARPGAASLLSELLFANLCFCCSTAPLPPLIGTGDSAALMSRFSLHFGHFVRVLGGFFDTFGL